MDKKQINILLVEDDSDDSLLTRESLSQITDMQILVHASPSLTKALQSIANNTYDLILLDLYLPDSSGLATIDAIRRKAPNVPVVVLTGLENETISNLALEKGVQGYYSKDGANTQMLVKVIKSALSHKIAGS
jgi:DNA-binding NarL/FixJ family response regulator